jgi:hypothetical protein
MQPCMLPTSFNCDQLHTIVLPCYVLYVVMLQVFPICGNLVALYMHQFYHRSIPGWTLIGNGTGDLFMAWYADCIYNENHFPALGGEFQNNLEC